MKWIVEANSIDDLIDGKFAILDRYEGDIETSEDDCLRVNLRPCSYCQEFTCEDCRYRHE